MRGRRPITVIGVSVHLAGLGMKIVILFDLPNICLGKFSISGHRAARPMRGFFKFDLSTWSSFSQNATAYAREGCFNKPGESENYINKDIRQYGGLHEQATG